MEALQQLGVSHVQSPGLTSILKARESDCLVHFQLGWELRAECCAGLAHKIPVCRVLGLLYRSRYWSPCRGNHHWIWYCRGTWTPVQSSVLFLQWGWRGNALQIAGRAGTGPPFRLDWWWGQKRRAAFANLLTTIWRADSFCAIKAQSSAKRASRIIFFATFVLALKRRRSKRDSSVLYFKYTPSLLSFTAWLRIQVKKKLNSTGVRTHSCCTPFEIVKCQTSLHGRLPDLSYYHGNWRIRFVNFLGQPSLSSIVHSASLLTVSHALVRLIKTVYRSSFCSLHCSCNWRTAKIISTVLRLSKDDTVLLASRFSSEMAEIRQLRMMRARIFPAIERRQISR